MSNNSNINIRKAQDEYTFIEQIFSIKNLDEYKIIKILGIPIKIPRSVFLKKYYKLPIQKNKIVFSNYMGRGYGCNPKYIAEEILKRKLDYDLVWLISDEEKINNFPKGIRLVNYHSKEALKELMTAKIWVNNYHKAKFIKSGLIKKEGQIYIQTWHGSLGIKKIEKLVNCLTVDKKWTQYAIKNSKMVDYWISNSKFETNVYKESFWDVKTIKEFGHPRNDIFFKDTKKYSKKVKEFYNIKEDTKILLYAPSFREDESLKYYQLDYQKVQNTLETITGDRWIITTRLHPRIAKFSEILLNEQKNVIDVSWYPDIQELLVSADCMITDYSSCIFDFMLSRKPAFIYATDIEDYNSERGFYYPLKSTPFPIAKNNEELIKNIENFDNDKYQTNVEEFLKEKGCIDDGHASERVVNLIKELIEY